MEFLVILALSVIVVFLIFLAIGLGVKILEERKRADTADERADEKIRTALIHLQNQVRQQEQQLANQLWQKEQERQRADTADARADEKVRNATVQLTNQLRQEEKQLRADAIKKSTAVVKGKVAEQLVPFREGFGYNPRDCRFLGSPVDFLVFDGLTEGALDQIVLIEVKTGKTAALSRRERQVRDIVDEGEVYYRVLHIREGEEK